MNKSILLVKPPFFSPLTPPLGIAILKSFLWQHGFPVRCFDFNVDPELWGTHHKYFKVLQELEDVSINDGYSKLWWILNAHLLAYTNGADRATCARVLRTIIPFYGISCDARVIESLLPIVERFFMRLEEQIDHLNLAEYSVVGTSTYTTSLASSLFFLKKVKERYPHITTVMGGGVFADDLALGSDNLQTLIDESSYIDHLILGEGEMLFLRLLQGELSDKRVISIANVTSSKLEMNSLPGPDFSDFDPDGYYHLSIEGARSCPFQCSFCSETIQWGTYRKKSMEQFAEQVIGLAERYGNNSFFMGDSLMNPYIGDFSKELLKRNAKIAYDGYLRADKPVANRERVRSWARSGLYRVRLGIESASARVLDLMGKMTSPAVIAEVFKSLASAGIRPTTYWIVGFPGETEQDFQDTLDFIQENHRCIYELEAHPYYYYPYGQIGSRLHQCYSLYPDEITKVIKYKVWDIVDGHPTREERYDRLRRISRLASELGLPNIYTMAERYQAEERWHSLHPLATEVYRGTALHRDAPSRTERSPAPPVAEAILDAGRRQSILGYHMKVAKKLDASILRHAMSELIDNCETLQMNFIAPTGEEKRSDDLAFIVDIDEESEEAVSAGKREWLEKFASEMRPVRGGSVKAILVNRRDGASDLLLFAHRCVADGRSIILLCECLFRIYEQLANDMKVSLRPVRKTYAGFIEEMEAEGLNGELAVPVLRSPGERASFLISQPHKRRLFEKPLAGKLKPADVFLVAVLRVLNKLVPSQRVKVEIAYDYRLADADLGQTVGNLTKIERLASGSAYNEDLIQHIQEIQQALRSGGLRKKACANGEEMEEATVLVNLELFVADPWLGGDTWSSRGFVVSQLTRHQSHELVITPHLSPEGIEVCLQYRASAPWQEIVDELTALLPQELESVLSRLERVETAVLTIEETNITELDESFSFSN